MMNEPKHSEIENLRRKIKIMVGENLQQGNLLLSESDAMKFIHEIEVQQLELEMQNEELILAREQEIFAGRKNAELYDFAPSGYFTLSSRGIIEELNNSGASMLGKERASLLDSSFGFFVSYETRPDFIQFLSDLFLKLEKKTCEIDFPANGSGSLTVSLSGTVDPGGEHCYLTAIDITDRKRMEEELRISEQKYKTIFEQSVIGKSMTSVSDGKIIVNKAFCEMLGYSEAELTNLNWQAITHPEDLKRDLEIGNLLISGEKETARFEKRFIHRNGNIIWVDISTRLQCDQKNNPLFFSTSVIEITRRKLAEQELLHANQELESQNRENERRSAELILANAELSALNEKLLEKDVQYRNLANSGPSLIWTSGTDKLCNFFNNSWLKFTGRTLEQEIGNGWTEGVHPADFDRCLETYVNAFDQRKPFEMEYRLMHVGGEYKWIQDLGTPNYNLAGEFVGYIGNCFDITEHKRIEQELVAARDHAEQNERLQSAFLANMSHEIRTPMNGILGFAELLKEPGLTGLQQQDYVQIIEKSGERMLNIINDIIDISKIESEQMKVWVSATNINEKIEYIHTFFKPETDNKGIVFSYKNGLPGTKANVLTDSEKIYAILTNLVKNAIKFCNNGSIEIGYDLVETLHEMSLPNNSMSLLFYVKDTGIGIPKDRLLAIFDRFIQIDLINKMALQGAGLGLSISKAYVEMLGGKIWVESEMGKGSTFFFTLPYRVEAKEETADTSLVSVNDTLILNRKLRILIAEDDEISERLLEREVARYSETVFKVKTGSEAIAVCRENPDLDLVLMDIRMSGMDGYEATRQIRQFNKEVVIIAQTAFALVGDSEKAMRAGCTDYIPKPIKNEKLMEVIQKYF